MTKLHDEREADQQTIANLETVVHAYKRAAENAEQTTRELRNAQQQARIEALTQERDEAVMDKPEGYLGMVQRIADVKHALAAERERADALKLALDKADPLDPSFLRYLELEQQLQAERERAESLKLALDKADPLDPSFLRYLELEQLQATREKLLEAEHLASRLGGNAGGNTLK